MVWIGGNTYNHISISKKKKISLGTNTDNKKGLKMDLATPLRRSKQERVLLVVRS